MSEYFPKPKSLGANVKVELDLSNYATKSDLILVDTWVLLEKTDLANSECDVDKLDIDKWKNVSINLSNLKSKIDKLDVDKLVPALVDLSKLSDVVKNDVVKKDVCKSKIKDNEDEIPDITNLATNTPIDATTALTTAENKLHEYSK